MQGMMSDPAMQAAMAQMMQNPGMQQMVRERERRRRREEEEGGGRREGVRSVTLTGGEL